MTNVHNKDNAVPGSWSLPAPPPRDWSAVPVMARPVNAALPASQPPKPHPILGRVETLERNDKDKSIKIEALISHCEALERDSTAKSEKIVALERRCEVLEAKPKSKTLPDVLDNQLNRFKDSHLPLALFAIAVVALIMKLGK